MRRMISPRNSPTGRRASTRSARSSSRNSSRRSRPSSEMPSTSSRRSSASANRNGVASPSSSSSSRSRVDSRFASDGDDRQVLVPHAVPRSHQDAGELDGGERVRHGARVRQHLDHLGDLQQARQPDDLHRHARAPRTPAAARKNSRLVRQSTAISAHFAPSSWSRTHSAAIQRASVHLVGVAGDTTSPSPLGGYGTSAFSGSGRWAGGQRRDHRVGGLEDARARAEVRVQRELRRGRAVGPAERSGKSSRLYRLAPRQA